ncbi:pyrimidine utilization protein D [Rosenbergiella collisarenosi]|uniref:pyrimidine utilization protein D n=1 Tax=Rosenbergiella collisarenosi TaxID=1544695 RepID=UPI001BDA59C1|nr:pyrimidine utilization protein D [Rosenbergiella collisarenosi]MBT0720851.1 pyrimidine utilization protein D [Rosenbergiella collisarenosi]
MTSPVAHRISGVIHDSAPTVLLSSGLGGVGSFWAPQLAILEADYRVIVYDQRGTGLSKASLSADYSMTEMANDVIELLDHLAIDSCHFVGHALGGIIGMRLATLAPQRLASLVIINSWATLDSQTRRCFEVRLDLLSVSEQAYIHAQPLFLYPADWLSQHTALLDAEEAHQLAHFQGADNLRLRLAALMNTSFADQLATLHVPCFILCARDDLLVPWTCSQTLAEGLPNSELYLFEYGAHAMCTSDPDAFNLQLAKWLKKVKSS